MRERLKDKRARTDFPLFLLAEVAEIGARQSDARIEKEAGQSDAELSSPFPGLGEWVS